MKASQVGLLVCPEIQVNEGTRSPLLASLFTVPNC